jgi:hypothetical protein
VFQIVSFIYVCPPKTVHTPSLTSIRSTCPVHLILLDLTIRIIFHEDYRSLISSLCRLLHSLFTSSFLDPNILLSTYSRTPSAYIFSSMWQTDFHTHTKQHTKLRLKMILVLIMDTFSPSDLTLFDNLSAVNCQAVCTVCTQLGSRLSNITTVTTGQKNIGSENAVWSDDGRKDARNMLRDNWLPIKSLIVASSWSHIYLIIYIPNLFVRIFCLMCFYVYPSNFLLIHCWITKGWNFR